MSNEVKKLLGWIRDNIESESIFLTPNPSHSVDAQELLVSIMNIFKLSSEDISGVVNYE